MCTPTAGSPTITLFQLRSNYHALLNVYKLYCLKYIIFQQLYLIIINLRKLFKI